MDVQKNMKFQEFVHLKETTFKNKQIKKYELNDANHQIYNGWQIWFRNKTSQENILVDFCEFCKKNEVKIGTIIQHVTNREAKGNFKSMIAKIFNFKTMIDYINRNIFFEQFFYSDQVKIIEIFEKIKNQKIKIDKEEFDFIKKQSYEKMPEDENNYINFANKQIKDIVFLSLNKYLDESACQEFIEFLNSRSSLELDEIRFDHNDTKEKIFSSIMNQVERHVKNYLEELNVAKNYFQYKFTYEELSTISLMINRCISYTLLYLWQEYNNEKQINFDFAKYLPNKVPDSIKRFLNRPSIELYEYLFHESINEKSIQEFLYKSIKDVVIDEYEKFLLKYNAKKEDDISEYESYLAKAMKASKKVIDTLTTLNIRNYHRVPIVFHYQKYQQPAGYGISSNFAAGNADKDHINVYGNLSFEEMVTVLAHELGHIIFARLSAREQRKIYDLARKGNLISDYGKHDYVFPGEKSPTIHHNSGNEWFATMIEYLAGSSTLPNNKPLEKDFSGVFKDVKNIISSSPNHGIGYKSIHTARIKQFRPPRRIEPRKTKKSS